MLQFSILFILYLSTLLYKAESPLIVGYRFVKSYSSVKISHYDLKVNALPKNKEVKIKCRADFIPLNNTDKILIFLNSGFKIKNVKREGVNLKFQRWKISGVFISLYWVYLDRELLNREKFTLDIEYQGKPVSFSSSFDKNGVEMDIYSFFYPTVFFENFFTANLSITVPENQTAIGNGILYKIESDNNTKTYHYKTMTPLPVMSIISGNFLSKKGYLREKTISVYYHPDYEDIIPKIIEYSSYILDFFENKFGILPCKNLTIVQTKRVNSSCYSSSSVVVINQGTIDFIKKEQENFEINLFALLAHELSHQFWGNLVAPDIKEGWVLVEGLAEYSSLLAIENKFGKEKFRERLNYDYNIYLNYLKNVKKEKPLSKSYLFLENTVPLYYKGALVFNMIRNTVGEEKFYLILKEYLSNFSFKFAKIEDFQKTCEKKQGQKLDFIFKQFIRGTKKIDLETVETLDINRENSYKILK